MSRCQYKKKKKQQSFMQSVDMLTDDLFSKETLEMFDIDHESMANHLGALIASKGLLMELDQLNSEIFRFDQNPLSFDNHPRKDYIERMAKIQKLCTSARDLLYTYNKERLMAFIQSRENLIILENFLKLLHQNITINNGEEEMVLKHSNDKQRDVVNTFQTYFEQDQNLRLRSQKQMRKHKEKIDKDLSPGDVNEQVDKEEGGELNKKESRLFFKSFIWSFLDFCQGKVNFLLKTIEE